MATRILSAILILIWIASSYQELYPQSNGDLYDLSLDSLLNLKVSSAARYEQRISEAPASVTIITSKDIEDYGYRTLEEVLMNVRGFYVSNDRNYSYVGVRGFGRSTDYNNRFLLLIDGHTLNENVYGSAFIGTELGLNLAMVDRIEIVRGPASALYGTNAMFAVINIVTKSTTVSDGLRISSAIGSFGRQEGSFFFGKKFDDGTQIFASGLLENVQGQNLYYPEYDDPSSNNGIAMSLDWDRPRSVFGSISTNKLSLSGMYSTRRKGIPTGAFSVMFNNSFSQTLDERMFVEGKYRTKFSADKVFNVRGYFDRYNYTGVYPYIDAVEYDGSENNLFGGDLQFIWDLQSNNRLTLGSEYQNNFLATYYLVHDQDEKFNRNFPFHKYSFYLEDEYQFLDNLSMTFGVHFRRHSNDRSNFTPRGALVFNPSNNGTLKLLYGEAFREPNVYEMYYEDELIMAKGNPALEPENIKTYELVWDQQLSGEFFAVGSIYHYTMTNLIDQHTDPSDSFLVFQNLSEVEAMGAEVELTARLKSGINGYLNYAITRAEDKATEAYLTNSPVQLARLGFVFSPTIYSRLGLQFVYETGRLTLYGTTTDPLFLTNLNIVLKPRLRSDYLLSNFLNKMKFAMLAKNLFNTGYKTPGGLEHVQDAIQQNGREFSFNLTYQF